MQPVAAGVMSFFTRCFFWIAYNTNTWRALFRPLTHTSISEGQAVALHSNFLAYSGQQMKPLWGEILHSALPAGLAVQPHSHCYQFWNSWCHNKGFGQEAQHNPFNCAWHCSKVKSHHHTLGNSFRLSWHGDCVRNTLGENAVTSQEKQ